MTAAPRLFLLTVLKAWQTNSLAGCILEVESEFTSATHGQIRCDCSGQACVQNSFKYCNALTVQQNENATIQDEFTRCDEYLDGGGDPGRPRNNLSRVVTGAAYTITCGDHAQGFGDPWNKSIIDFEILDDVLYASIGLNYAKGCHGS